MRARYRAVIGGVAVARGTRVARRPSMRKVLLAALLVGCASPSSETGGDDAPTPDASETSQATCPLPASMGDAGTLDALKSQRCNVPMSMGTRKWYRLSATLPGAPADIVQLELWDGQGAFSGGTVRTGTFQLTGAELSYATCGICLRAVGDKGTADAKTYFATGGTVEITAVGAAGAELAATITNATFVEVDAQNKPIASGCAATLANIAVSGTVVDVGGGGGGGGTGGGASCPATVGD
jgi:hypothetical protein